MCKSFSNKLDFKSGWCQCWHQDEIWSCRARPWYRSIYTKTKWRKYVSDMAFEVPIGFLRWDKFGEHVMFGKLSCPSYKRKLACFSCKMFFTALENFVFEIQKWLVWSYSMFFGRWIRIWHPFFSYTSRFFCTGCRQFYIENLKKCYEQK